MHNSTKKSLRCGAAVIAIWSAAASVGHAQSDNTVAAAEVSSAPTPGFVAHRSLSASKTDTPLIELPRAVSVVTADEMRNRGVDTVGQIFQYSAGVNSDAYGGGPLSRVYSNARGFFAFQYLDGLKLHDSNWGVETYGLERAELLKGPPSALFGQSNPGGVLNLVSKRPVDRPLHEVVLQAGSYNRVQGAIDVGGPIDKAERFLFRFTAMARDSDTQVDHGKDNRIYIAPAVTWRATDRTDLTVLAAYQYDPHLTMFQFLPRFGSADPSAGGFGRVSRRTYISEPSFDQSDKTLSQVAYLLEHRFNAAITARQNFRYTYIDIHTQYLQGGGALQANGRSIARTGVIADYTINIAQIDNQLAARFDTGAFSHNLLAGFDYAYLPIYQGNGSLAGPALDLFAPVYGVAVTTPILTTKRQQHIRQGGFYLQDQIKVGNLSVLVGLRQDHATATTRNRARLTGVITSFVRQEDDALTGQAGAIYAFDNGLAPYISYAKSFFPTAGTDFFGKPFDPATGEQYEAGLKFQPNGWNVLATAAVFDLRQQNVRTADLAHPNFSVQTGEIRSRGFELEAKATLAKLNLSAAYTYLDNKVTKSNTTNLGKRPPGRPVNQASVWADYAVAPFLTVGGGVKYVSSSFGDTLNTFRVPSYATADALARVQLAGLQPDLKGWDLSLNASNLFDKRYVSNCDAATQCFYAPGRLVKATLRRSW